MSASAMFRRLFSSKPTYRHPKPVRQTRLAIDTLENRECPAFVSAGILMIEGSNGTDTVYVTQTTPANWWEIPKVQVNHNGFVQTFSNSLIYSGVVRFNGYGGNDYFQNSGFLYVNADGGTGADTLSGGPMDDILVGGTNNDAIYGNEGVDQIWGGQGNDEMRGGGGNDTLYGDIDNDTMRGGPGSDVLYGNDGLDTMYGDNNAGIAGGYGADTLYGGLGNDTIAGEGGSDVLQGGGDSDFLYGNDGNDTLYGDNRGTPGYEAADYLFGGWGWDTLYGEGGNDYIRGEGDPDTLFGGHGNDTMFGDNAGNPWGGESDDVLNGGWGNDTMSGEGRDDLLRGDGDSDVLYGNIGNDTLYGGTQYDYLDGGAGNDGLFGGANDGYDALVGGPNTDRFLTMDGEDGILDRAGEDARIAFFNSAAQSNLMMTGQTGTFSFDAGAWTDADIQRVDVALANLHRHVGNTRLLKTAGRGEMSFQAVGVMTAGNAPVAGWNSGTRITFVDPAGMTDNDIQDTVYHEFGHNWDDPSETAHATAFWNVSGWQVHDSDGGPNAPAGYTLSTDGTSEYLTSAYDTFARDYGRTNAHEDVATTWETYFINAYHGGMTGVTDQGMTANAAKWATMDALFGELRGAP